MIVYVLIQADYTQDSYAKEIIGVTTNKELADRWGAVENRDRTPWTYLSNNEVEEFELDVLKLENIFWKNKEILENLK